MKATKILFLILVILAAVIMSGCDAQTQSDIAGAMKGNAPSDAAPSNSTIVIPLGLMATLDGLRNVVAGGEGTLIVANERLVLMAWPVDDKYGFAIIARDGKPIYETLKAMGWSSQAAQPLDVAQLIDFAFQKGWKSITPDQLPAAIIASLANATASTATRILPNVLVLPAGNLSQFMPAAPVKD